MSTEFHSLEESLKNFLTDPKNNSDGSPTANLYKYNNLKIYMAPSQNATPHYIIRIGISEAMYSIESGEKISGGLGKEEGLIRRWLERTFVKNDMTSAWKIANKTKSVSTHEDED